MLVLVELTEPSASVAYAKATAGKSIQNSAVRTAAAAATRASMQRVAAQQKSIAAQIGKIGAREVYRVSRAVNGIAVAVEAKDLPRLRALQGVRRVLPIPRETPSLSSSVPFLGLPDLWQNTLGLPNALTGAGVRIGIIDTGIDYLHADFGGSGAAADYAANTALPNPHFPSLKVVGGVDLAGDAYNGSNTPVPDAADQRSGAGGFEQPDRVCRRGRRGTAGRGSGAGRNPDGAAGAALRDRWRHLPARAAQGTSRLDGCADPAAIAAGSVLIRAARLRIGSSAAPTLPSAARARTRSTTAS